MRRLVKTNGAGQTARAICLLQRTEEKGRVVSLLTSPTKNSPGVLCHWGCDGPSRLLAHNAFHAERYCCRGESFFVGPPSAEHCHCLTYFSRATLGAASQLRDGPCSRSTNPFAAR